MKSTPMPIVKIVFSLAVVFNACSGEKKPSSADINLNAVSNSQSIDPDVLGDNKCLLEFQLKYDGILTESEVLAATGFSKDNMKTQYNKALKNPETHEFLYKFKNGRIGKIRGLDQKMKLDDVIAIGSIKPMSLAAFGQNYKAITDEQKELANDALNEVVDGKSGNADANRALEKAKELNVANEQIKETGNALTEAFQEVSKGYRKVEGLGDAATWNVATNELIVLQNGVKFEIRTNISEDNQKNKDVAMTLAKVVLDKCN